VEKNGRFTRDPAFFAIETDGGKADFFIAKVNYPLLPVISPIRCFKDAGFGSH